MACRNSNGCNYLGGRPPYGAQKCMRILYSAAALLCLTLCSLRAETTLPTGFTETEIANGVAVPIAFDFVPDGRFFICEQSGNVRVIKNGQLLAAPLLSLTVDSDGERGLVALAVDPNFASNGYIFVIYTIPATASAPAYNVLSRFTVNGNTADAASEFRLFQFDNFGTSTSHCVASLAFGPDGKIWIGTGDNGNPFIAQNLQSDFGKMLRLNPDGSIPSDNPFYNSNPGDWRAIWAYGLRNPYTFSFQPGTGRLFINDVDSQTFEEINEGKAGANYGWNIVTGQAHNPSYVDPIFAYPYGKFSLSTGCAISGGTFYNPATPNFPSNYVGNYFFMDYCNGWISRLDPNNVSDVTVFASNMPSDIIQLKAGPDGSLYYIYRGSGSLRRIQYQPGNAPGIAQEPASQTVAVGGSATFTVSASGTAPFTYRWQRDNADITGASGPSYMFGSAALSDSGAKFHCIVSNIYGSATSNDATLTVSSRSAPTASIISPPQGTHYTAGESIAFSASAQDSVDGTLPDSAYSWKVDLVAANQVRPYFPATTGANGMFTTATVGLADPAVIYRITLSVTNSAGISTTVTRDLLPTATTLHLQTVPDGAAFSLDGQVFTSAQSIQSVVGFTHTIAVTTPQTLAGVIYDFAGWSDNGDAAHSINTPGVETTYTALFQIRGAPVISGPTATPNSPFETDPVSFAATAIGAAPLSWAWDFGDGATSTDAQTTHHSYAVAGAYTVALTVTDAHGLSSTSVLNLNVLHAAAMHVSRLTAALNFKQSGHDQCALSATLNTPAFTLNQSVITVDVSGAASTFTLNAKGQSTSAGGRIVAHFKKNKNSDAGTLSLTLAIKNSDCAAAWSHLGVNPAATQTTAPMQMTITVTLNGATYRATVNGSYTAKANLNAKFSER
jgi:glucose/arabinose dehydrogenase/PKD repeat protein